MSGKFFKDALSEETIIELTSEMLKEENMNKNLSKPRLGNALLKIIPAAAMVALIIGAINLIPAMLSTEVGPSAGSAAPGIYANSYDSEEIALYVPWVVEKNFFEERILAAIPDDDVIVNGVIKSGRREKDKLLAYYALRDPSAPDLTDRGKQEILEAYPFTQNVPVYTFDPNASEREKDYILEMLSVLTDLTGNELMLMFTEFDLPAQDPNPPESYNYFSILINFVPWVMEKDFFETNVLAVMPDGIIRDKMLAYYTLIDPAQFDSIQDYLTMYPPMLYEASGLVYNATSEAIEKLLLAYEEPFNQGTPFYLFDIFASERERNQILGFLRDLTDLTDGDVMRMFENFGFPTENPNPIVYIEEEYYE